jgi:glucosylceramidase
VQGWIDWNLLLDADGGPNHKGNNCDAPILANTDYSGINIQPKFYVMGHFSRYVVPGSRRIDSHVVGDFRYDKSDPRVREGFEAGLFSCERSSRQMWRLTSEGLLALTLQSVQDGMLMDLCIAAGQGDRPFLRMVYCTGSKDSEPIKVALVDGSRLVEAESGLCFGVVSSVTESGALLELAVCSEKDTRQRFSVDSKSGEVRASVGLDLCLTAGWPLLAGVSFINGDETVTVLINEASTDTEVVLHDVVRNEYIKFGINARSVQTILYK